MEVINRFQNLPTQVKWLLGAVLSIILISIIISVTVFISTAADIKMYQRDLCFTNTCLISFFSDFEVIGKTIGATLSLCVAVATIGGIFIALMSYLSSQNNYAFNNHLEHLKVFCDYLGLEIKKRDRLSERSINHLMLYRFIFSNSRSGSAEVSKEFLQYLTELNDVIQSTGKVCEANKGAFDYRGHQKKIKEHFEKIGVSIPFAPRNDFFEAEKQVLSLLNRISQSFCDDKNLKNLENPKYY